MAFLKWANAIVMNPHISSGGWSKLRTANVTPGMLTSNLSEQANRILGQSFDPERFLLTHATIVASVDTVEVPNVKTGMVVEDRKKVNRKYSDYRITAETDKFANNNFDSFARAVLLKCYRTFVGAQNFCEHVQLEELSKGRILDSVIRDVGEALYVDILVATDRKHTELVQSILNHEMSTLSMGATVEETTCTRCGNVAVDETDLCDHIKYQKGSIFHNEMGQKLRTVELCGHPSLDPTGGVRFIEASWVKNPAFTGAVMRNIIDPVTLSQHIKRQAQEILNTPPPQWIDTSIKKVAFDFGDEGGGDEGGESSAPAEPSQPADVLEKIESQVTDLVLDRVVKKINDAQKSKDPPPLSPEQSTAQPNDSIIKEATVKVARAAYAASAKAMVKTAKNEADFMSRIADLDASFGIKADVRLYRTALMHGPISAHKSERDYILKCAKTLRESLDNQEAFTLIRLGRLMEILPKKTPQDA